MVEIKEKGHNGFPSEEIQVLFEEARGQVVTLHRNWNLYCELFQKNEERIKLLNWAGSWFFFEVQRLFIADTYLGLCRLTDPPETAGHANASFEQLREKLNLPEESLAMYNAKLNRLRDLCKPMKVQRNHFLAHLDLNRILDCTVDPLDSVTKDDVDKALETAAELLNSVAPRPHTVSKSIRFSRMVDQFCNKLAAAREHKKSCVTKRNPSCA